MGIWTARSSKVWSRLDISRESIDAARAAAKAANLKVDFRLGDMRRIEGSFDAAFCWGNSFGYLPHAETKQFVQSLSRALKPGSSFVLQTGAVAEVLFAHFHREAVYEVGNIDFRIRNTYEPETSVLQTEYSFTRDGKTETRLGWQSIYTCGEICRMLAEADMNVVHMHQSIEGQPFEFGAQALILTAQRAG